MTVDELESAGANAIEQLTAAVGRGEIGIDEFDRRSRLVAGAASIAAVRDAVADIGEADIGAVEPGTAGSMTTPASAPVSRRPARPERYRKGLAVESRVWASVGAINLVIWAVLAVSVGAVYFWPVWVIGPWGAALLMRWLAFAFGASGTGRGGGHASSCGSAGSERWSHTLPAVTHTRFASGSATSGRRNAPPPPAEVATMVTSPARRWNGV